MTRPTSQDRAAELNRLIVEQGMVTRSMRYGYEPTDEVREHIAARAARLLELTELLEAHVHAPGMGPDPVTPDRYVNERLAAWMRMNPLTLTNQRLLEQVRETTKTQNPETSSTCGVTVQIGEDDRAYHYTVMADDLVAVRGGARVIFRLPDAVAEHFRQQGRRKAQRDMQQSLGL